MCIKYNIVFYDDKFFYLQAVDIICRLMDIDSDDEKKRKWNKLLITQLSPEFTSLPEDKLQMVNFLKQNIFLNIYSVSSCTVTSCDFFIFFLFIMNLIKNKLFIIIYSIIKNLAYKGM